MNRSATFLRSLALAETLGAALALSLESGALAVGNPSGTGQPGAECGDEGAEMEPHGFTTTGFAHAELVYAGGEDSRSNPDNEHAVSQYDVACFQITSNH